MSDLRLVHPSAQETQRLAPPEREGAHRKLHQNTPRFGPGRHRAPEPEVIAAPPVAPMERLVGEAPTKKIPVPVARPGEHLELIRLGEGDPVHERLPSRHPASALKAEEEMAPGRARQMLDAVRDGDLGRALRALRPKRGAA